MNSYKVFIGYYKYVDLKLHAQHPFLQSPVITQALKPLILVFDCVREGSWAKAYSGNEEEHDIKVGWVYPAGTCVS